MKEIFIYRNYAKKNLRNAWQLAGMPNALDRLVGIAVKIIFAVLVLYGISDYANAAREQETDRQTATMQAQAREIEALRKVLAACLGDREGALWIDKTLFLCGISNTGIQK